MSFQQTIYSTPNFQIIPNQGQRQLVAPWAGITHLPSSVVLGSSNVTLTPEQTVSGTILVTPQVNAINYQLPDSASWYRFLSTRSVPGYENISNNDVFVLEVINANTGTANIVPGTGAGGIVHPVYKVSTGAYCACVPVQWKVTSTGTFYNVL
jgi:hypothetical protein